MSSWTQGVAASTGLLLPLVACSPGDVSIESPDVSAAERTSCESLLAALPDTLADESSRTVTPADALGAAWGDPAITLTCGVDVPDSFDRLSSCTQVNGVGWYVPEGAAHGGQDTTFTAVGYRPVVALEVPADYLPEGGAAALAELAQPVKEHLRLVNRCE